MYTNTHDVAATPSPCLTEKLGTFINLDKLGSAISSSLASACVHVYVCLCACVHVVCVLVFILRMCACVPAAGLGSRQV